MLHVSLFKNARHERRHTHTCIPVNKQMQTHTYTLITVHTDLARVGLPLSIGVSLEGGLPTTFREPVNHLTGPLV